MGEVTTKILFFHRLFLAFRMGTLFSLAGTAALYVRWQIGPAVACLIRSRREKTGREEEAEPEFQIEREKLIVFSREQIGGRV